MPLLHLSLFPAMFMASTFSTKPVEASKYRCRLSYASCLFTMLLVCLSCYRLLEQLFVLAVFPLITGLVPAEQTVRHLLRNTRIWGLSYAYLARIQGNVGFLKWYLRTEMIMRLIHLQLENIYIISNQVLFFSLSSRLLAPRFHSFFVHFFFMVLVRVFQCKNVMRTLGAMFLLHMGRTVFYSCHHTALNIVYLLLMGYEGEPGRDTRLVRLVRRLRLSALDGLEEYWLPLVVRLAPVLLCALLCVAALRDASCWTLCALVWYNNVFVGALRMAEYYLGPIKDVQAHKALYPRSGRRERDWTGRCPICWDDMQPCSAWATPCGHIFHAECLGTALETTSNNCPLCRWPLPTRQSSSEEIFLA
ncbi:uncharacterized protein LOC134538059 [Bacillus rossius redtenbacheri]|uniref:uncharacterized protein LOC134538059 n=1 Tax=Bacillus rossius redtenbacheri TaxID=93214 RepID=UPI002FDE8D32